VVLTERFLAHDPPLATEIAALRDHLTGTLDPAIIGFHLAKGKPVTAEVVDKIARGDVYLDYTGGSLYAASQVEEHHRMLRDCGDQVPPQLGGGPVGDRDVQQKSHAAAWVHPVPRHLAAERLVETGRQELVREGDPGLEDQVPRQVNPCRDSSLDRAHANLPACLLSR
jgi:hypothetical protein